MSLTLSIDLASYLYGKINPSKPSKEIQPLSASVIIPAHNEEDNIVEAVKAQYQQTKKPKNVVVINDNSTDRTDSICRTLQGEYPNFVYVNNKGNKGKAESIGSVVENYYSELGDIIYVNDGDTVPDKNCLEELVKGFDEPNVAAVTGLPKMVGGGGLISKALTNGKKWQIEVLHWRKSGQVIRNGMYVLCGAVMAIRKDVLKEYPIPTRTKTEDLDYTWILQERGYKLKFQEKATCQSYDVIGLKNHWKQTRRWHSGAWQALYCHGHELKKSKGLFYTSLVPMLTEIGLYFGRLAVIPFLYSYDPALLAGLFAADATVYAGITLFSKPSYIKYLPAGFFYAGLCAVSYAVSGIETTFQKLTHQEDKWRNKWGKNQEVGNAQTEIKENC